MTFSRRGLVSRLSRTIFALAAFGALGVASAQTGKPVKLMVGFPPGGGTDASWRSGSRMSWACRSSSKTSPALADRSRPRR